ncbi:hypothetical protein [Micromonospora deserti]|uniref:Uncharacterized protein n=1 Tax=Micromonospora deserti TaxID=2070366 RepID=A0A2W2CTK4_9ACTN|nr:hypothetical protein [Micromonospora deserti]PZG02942.1 hypothetical protein C1I99_00315 [Micromonospora deserti]
MRISIKAGLGLAGAAAVAAVVVAGGVAYAGEDVVPEPVVQIVTEQGPGTTGGAQSVSEEDCPDKGGAASTAPEEAASSQAL